MATLRFSLTLQTLSLWVLHTCKQILGIECFSIKGPKLDTQFHATNWILDGNLVIIAPFFARKAEHCKWASVIGVFIRCPWCHITIAETEWIVLRWALTSEFLHFFVEKRCTPDTIWARTIFIEEFISSPFWNLVFIKCQSLLLWNMLFAKKHCSNAHFLTFSILLLICDQ